MTNIRNFVIIAHIDHGKSTLADRFLEVTKTIDKSKIKEQMLDSMDLERERGITIKLQPARMKYTHNGQEYELNLIDTPGHVDFGYEVSRSLAAVEGALLLVDATQGIQAQTLANLAIANKQGLTIIPVVNKIDLPNAQPEQVAFEVAELLGCSPDDVCFASGKTGEGVPTILQAIIDRIPAPSSSVDLPPRALVFDSYFNTYRGVIAYVRVIDGELKAGQAITMMVGGTGCTVEEVGVIAVDLHKQSTLRAGEIGYVVTGLKRVADCRVGDTMTDAYLKASAPLSGYHQPQPMVYASVFEVDSDTNALRTALEKLSANDSAITYEPIYSDAFGSGFRVGFLGLLHLEITRERLEREFNLGLIVTSPVAAFRGDAINGYQEPWVKAEILAPTHAIGPVMDLASHYRGVYISLHYLGQESAKGATAVLTYEFPLAEIIIDFHDRLKSISMGYASMSYELLDYRPGDLVELNILIAGEKVSPFTQLVPRSQAEYRGRQITERLKELIPRQMFEVSIQAVIGARVVARETVSAMRKDVTAKLYGGDVTRKRKLLEKQKAGKKKMKNIGSVELPTDVFIEALKPKQH